jgi:hypothetical protein
LILFSFNLLQDYSKLFLIQKLLLIANQVIISFPQSKKLPLRKPAIGIHKTDMDRRQPAEHNPIFPIR